MKRNPHIAGFDASLFATAAAIAAVTDAGPVARIQLLPLGDMVLRDGRKFRIAGKAAAEAVIAHTKAYAGKMELAVDYDHQTELAAVKGVGGRAPAAGWISAASLTVEDDGIYGTVEWTPAATAALSAREYRYLSPTFWNDKAGNVLVIKGAGLVNIPAIDALASLAATDLNPETQMDYSKIATALGLAATATEAEILAAIAKLAGEDVGEMVATAATALGLATTASLKDILGAATTAATKTLEIDPKAFVPMAAFLELQASVASFQTDKTADAVTAALAAGKLSPAMKDWGLALCKSDPAAFAAFVDKAPVIVGGAGADLGAKPDFDGTAATLTETELATASALGLTPAAFATAKKDA